MHHEVEIIMIIEIEDKKLESLILYGKSEDKEYRKLQCKKTFMKDLDKVISILRMVPNTMGLSSYRSLHYERLKYDLSGLSSVRIGFKSPYRLLFTEFDDGIRISLIEISSHYGDK